ncbi:MAG: ABC transporter permease, partial [Patescibacteria group bacterium]|nr:ABC transporter permease [Patescibacteria group bacterium]
MKKILSLIKVNNFKKGVVTTTTFVLLLLLYITNQTLNWLGQMKPFRSIAKKLGPGWNRFFGKTSLVLDRGVKNSISRLELIEISLENLKNKKSRTLVTIGGMAVGVGAIVFLVSIGYGLQDLVVSKVARLEEMSQASVAPQVGSKLQLNDKTVADFNNLTGVSQVLPLISVVGKIEYEQAMSDMAVYGVTKDYLEKSAIQPIKGRIFDSNELALEVGRVKPAEVLGAKTDEPSPEFGQELSEVEFEIEPGARLRVRNKPSTEGQILGVTQRVPGKQYGTQVYGDKYELESGSTSQEWIKADFEASRDGKKVQVEGFIAQLSVKTSSAEI